MDIITVIRVFFMASAAGIIVANVVPNLQRRFISYGSRNSSTVPSTEQSVQTAEDRNLRTSLAGDVLDMLASLQVPHSWFSHFYVVSLLSSFFWIFQILNSGTFAAALEGRVSKPYHGCTSSDRLLTTMMLLAFQGGRRLYESIVFSKPSASRMWVGHWLMGLAFYVVMGVAVWIEGLGIHYDNESCQDPKVGGTTVTRIVLGVLIFAVASGVQHDCHRHLHSLPKYSLPTRGMFQILICPHYFAECLIYLSLAIAGAPEGHWLNMSIASALGFVLVNLGVTARNARLWYEQKFGQTSVAHRWNMIPFIF